MMGLLVKRSGGRSIPSANVLLPFASHLRFDLKLINPPVTLITDKETNRQEQRGSRLAASSPRLIRDRGAPHPLSFCC